MTGNLNAARVLCWREVVRFFRQRNRIIGAVGTPLMFWLLFGTGLQSTFRLQQADGGATTFMAYYVPGTLVLILMFTAIFTTISIIEDRREGFLQGVLVAPVAPWAIALGKVSGGTLIALFQGLFFAALGLTVGIRWGLLSGGQTVVLMVLTAAAVTGLGFVIAWKMDSVQGFHAIMNLFLMPMWLLSGAFFPVPVPEAGAAAGQWAMHAIMRLNPLTYCVAAIRASMGQQIESPSYWQPSPVVAWTVAIVFAVGMFLAACRIVRQRTAADYLS